MGKLLRSSLGVLLFSMICSRAAETISVEVPTRLVLKRTPDTLAISIAPTPMEHIEIPRNKDLFVGVRSSIRVFPAGEEGWHPTKGVTYTGEILFTGWTSILNFSSDGMPKEGVKYTVEVETIVYETDVQPVRILAPPIKASGILWKRILRQSSPEGEGQIIPVAEYSNADLLTGRRIGQVLRNAGIENIAAGSVSFTVAVDPLQADYARYKIAKAISTDKLDASLVERGKDGTLNSSSPEQIIAEYEAWRADDGEK